ncbi:MAG: transposase [Clostridia bacterium]|nr:transposase [Clostridia bacterium]
MSCITKQRVGKYTYLYESTSYRDTDGKPRNKKVRIGKLNLITGKPIYNQEYFDRMADAGTPIKIVPTETIANIEVNTFVLSAVDTLRDYGVFYLLQSIATKIGLEQVLSNSIPAFWKEIFMLSCYLISSDKPVMYCEDWITSNESLNVGSMSSQRISELLVSFGKKEREAFYQLWCGHITEQEYMALDITSVSSYSELITECEWGYNRDHENLPQINLCMLFGEDSKLPVFQTVYSGSLKDVSTLPNTLAEVTTLIGNKKVMIVMDKGFFSTKNINTLLSDYESCRFLISMPFTCGFAKKQVESECKDIDQISNTILTSGTPIRGIHKVRVWGTKGKKLHTHILFNPEKALKERNNLYGYVTWLKELALREPNNSKHSADISKYLIVRKSEKSGYTVNIREDIIEHELSTAGWVVLISNHIDNTQKAHDIYRTKDVVEKGFWKYKNSLGMDRLHVHSNERMHNKTFVTFISLIMMSYIHKVMKEKKLYRKMTFDKLLLTLAKIKVITINGKRVIHPLTKEQATIFKSFDIELP